MRKLYKGVLHMTTLSRGGEYSTAQRLIYTRSKLREARARMSACPWVATVYAEIERLELELESAVDAHIAAAGYDDPTFALRVPHL